MSSPPSSPLWGTRRSPGPASPSLLTRRPASVSAASRRDPSSPMTARALHPAALGSSENVLNTARPARCHTPGARTAASTVNPSSAFMTQVQRLTPGRNGTNPARTPPSRSASKNRSAQLARSPATPAPPPPPSSPVTELFGRASLLPPQTTARHLLVLDMDETLLHASTTPVEHDVAFNVVMGTAAPVTVYVKFRPHMMRFLEQMADLFEVAVFTASVPEYANQVLDYIDPGKRRIHHRLFRQHCTQVDGSYVKDLARLGRSLGRVAIVDNSPVAYLFHPQNAIAITSWFDEPCDRELLDLIPPLRSMAAAGSVYPCLEQIKRRRVQLGLE